jgi:hypothetical protein
MPAGVHLLSACWSALPPSLSGNGKEIAFGEARSLQIACRERKFRRARRSLAALGDNRSSCPSKHCANKWARRGGRTQALSVASSLATGHETLSVRRAQPNLAQPRRVHTRLAYLPVRTKARKSCRPRRARGSGHASMAIRHPELRRFGDVHWSRS